MMENMMAISLLITSQRFRCITFSFYELLSNALAVHFIDALYCVSSLLLFMLTFLFVEDSFSTCVFLTFQHGCRFCSVTALSPHLRQLSLFFQFFNPIIGVLAIYFGQEIMKFGDRLRQLRPVSLSVHHHLLCRHINYTAVVHICKRGFAVCSQWWINHTVGSLCFCSETNLSSVCVALSRNRWK